MTWTDQYFTGNAPTCTIGPTLYARRDALAKIVSIPADREMLAIDRLMSIHGDACRECAGLMLERRNRLLQRLSGGFGGAEGAGKQVAG